MTEKSAHETFIFGIGIFWGGALAAMFTFETVFWWGVIAGGIVYALYQLFTLLRQLKLF